MPYMEKQSILWLWQIYFAKKIFITLEHDAFLPSCQIENF